MRTLTLRPREDRRLRAGHPWIFSNEIAPFGQRPPAFEPGELVYVADAHGRRLGVAYYNPHTLIAARLLVRDGRPIDREFFLERVRAALALRERHFPGQRVYRLVFGEADGLPGLVVDRYGDVLVVEPQTAGMERLLPLALEALETLLAPAGIVIRRDAAGRRLEGLPLADPEVRGRVETPLLVELGGLVLEVDPLRGQKTGFFLDQRVNYGRVDAVAAGGRVLDVFCYGGAFGLRAARAGAREVVLVDSSAAALAAARRNAERNGLLERCRFEQADAFDYLTQADARGERFDLVILDPPAFARSRKQVAGARRGYKEVNRRAFRLLAPGGYLLTCSCSYHIDRETFRDIVRDAAADAGRSAVIVESGGQAPDHPVLLGCPETDYLKCLLVAVRDGPGGAAP
ncbi:MAG TPA: class I SAM-dependent rRNA methyltransferase [Thermodesulfobacteriota bacterium]|nr:class I SAM-dependent rRNA methyltransferase [Thermodesulfobacteriota bacterium]